MLECITLHRKCKTHGQIKEAPMCIYKLVNPIYPNPPLGQDTTQGQFLSEV